MKWERRLDLLTLLALLAITYPFLFLLFISLRARIVNEFRIPLSRSEAAVVLVEVRESLGISQDVTIVLDLVPETKCRTEWSNDNLRKLKVIIESHMVTRYLIEHVMYHISRIRSERDIGVFESPLGYFYVEEPLAITYAVLGIRLDFWN